MIYQNRSRYSRQAGGFLRFRSADRQEIYGYGEGDYIRLRDEFGNVWIGSAIQEESNLVRYRFRDDNGRSISGVSDSYGVILRDDKGKTWKGFVD
jgi:hypothetical protein